MKILFATSNEHKLKEIRQILDGFEIYALNELLKPFGIVENGVSFKQNARIKARAVFEKLSQKVRDEFVVLSDDSGICVDALNGEPGIFSARYSLGGSDAENRAKLIAELENLGLSESRAYFCAAICVSSKLDLKLDSFVAHGLMWGRVITQEYGENGFGYDPLFIAQGFDKTLAQLKSEEKNQISHRFKALNLAKIWLEILSKNY